MGNQFVASFEREVKLGQKIKESALVQDRVVCIDPNVNVGVVADDGGLALGNQAMKISSGEFPTGQLNRLLKVSSDSDNLKYEFERGASLKFTKSGQDIALEICEPVIRKQCINKLMNPINRHSWKALHWGTSEALDRIGPFINQDRND